MKLGNSIAIAQIGARHRYIIPRLFQSQGYRVTLITDLSEHDLIFKIFPKRFKSRYTNLLKFEVFSSSMTALVNLLPNITWLQLISYKSSVTFLVHSCKKVLIGKDLLYIMYSEFPQLAAKAKTMGIPIVLDVYVSPLTYEIVNEECENQGIPKRYSNVTKILKRIESNIENSTIIVAPSQWVAIGILHYWPEVEGKIRILPYGMSITDKSIPDLEIVRERMQFLFVGNDGLRKGLKYLLIAIQEVSKCYPEVTLMIAGSVRAQDYSGFDSGNVQWLGKINKEKLIHLYSRSTAIVSPSLSEGLPGSLIEAASCGCPIVCTRQSGLSINHGINGLIIKEKNVFDLSNQLFEIIENDHLRLTLSQNSYRLAGDFKEDAWSSRLMSLAQEIL